MSLILDQCVFCQFPARSWNMRIITLLFLLCLVMLTVFLAESRPIHKKHVEKRSLFGLTTFGLSFLNTILAISLNTSINR